MSIIIDHHESARHADIKGEPKPGTERERRDKLIMRLLAELRSRGVYLPESPRAWCRAGVIVDRKITGGLR